MGGGRWDPKDWDSYSTSKSYATKSVDAIYTARSIDPALDPKGITVRESRDSADNPNSTALMVGLDVTGSMGMILDVMAKQGLNTLATEVYARKPITDPHILLAGIGDVEAGDSAPLQVTQFEADIRIAEQLEKLYLERGGGGNRYESYALLWYFGARHTAIDCFDKRGRKGYLFTVGDEEPTPYLRAEDIERVFGYRPQAQIERDALLTEVSRRWEVFHIMVAEGSHARMRPDAVRDSWTNLLGQRAIWLEDHRKLAEVIVSVMQIHEGADAHAVADSWDGTTSLTVRNATAGLSKRSSDSAGLVTL